MAPALRRLPRRLRLPARSSPPAQSSHPAASRRPPRWDAAAALPVRNPLQPPPPPPRSPLSICTAPASSWRFQRFRCVQGIFYIFFLSLSQMQHTIDRHYSELSISDILWVVWWGDRSSRCSTPVACPGSPATLKNSEKVASSLPGSEEVAARWASPGSLRQLLRGGRRAPSRALVYGRAAGASQAAADMVGPRQSGRSVADRWQPRAEASLAGPGRRNRSPPWMSHLQETERSLGPCA